MLDSFDLIFYIVEDEIRIHWVFNKWLALCRESVIIRQLEHLISCDFLDSSGRLHCQNIILILPDPSYIHNFPFILSEELDQVLSGISSFEEHFFQSWKRLIDLLPILCFYRFSVIIWVLDILKHEIAANLHILSPLELLPSRLLFQHLILLHPFIRPPPSKWVVLKHAHEALIRDFIGIASDTIHCFIFPEPYIFPHFLLPVLTEAMSWELIMRATILIRCLTFSRVENASRAHHEIAINPSIGLLFGSISSKVQQSIQDRLAYMFLTVEQTFLNLALLPIQHRAIPSVTTLQFVNMVPTD